MSPPLTQEAYFFDFPLVDVNAIANSSMRLLYYGSTHGAFGHQNEDFQPLDIPNTSAIKVSLQPLSAELIDPNFSYSLVYLTRGFARQLWNGQYRKHFPALKKLTRRVYFNTEPSTRARRFKTPFWVRGKKDIYLTKYDGFYTNDNYVPADFLELFHNTYQGFLMRTQKDYPLVRTLFDNNGFELSARTQVLDRLDGNLQVLTYTAHKLAAQSE